MVLFTILLWMRDLPNVLQSPKSLPPWRGAISDMLATKPAWPAAANQQVLVRLGVVLR